MTSFSVPAFALEVLAAGAADVVAAAADEDDDELDAAPLEAVDEAELAGAWVDAELPAVAALSSPVVTTLYLAIAAFHPLSSPAAELLLLLDATLASA